MLGMASDLQASPSSLARNSLIEYLSIPRELAWGYVGLLLFMMGDGVESGYLAHFLHGEGISQKKSRSCSRFTGRSRRWVPAIRALYPTFGDHVW
jgi:hypothetical protein